jgi:hypothetical protein
MDQATIIPLSQEENILNELLTLEQARKKLVKLLARAEANAWDVGDLLNSIENRGLVRSEGFGKTRTWLEAKVPEADGKTSALYVYAEVAAHYTKEQTELWGVIKLSRLMIHDRETDGHRIPGDPADRDIQLIQEDGSTRVKKFRDCTCRELHLSTQRRKNAQKGPDQARVKPSKGEQTSHQSVEVPVRSVRKSLVALGLGILLIAGAEYLPTTFLNGWLFLFGTVLTLGSVGMLLRHWRVWWDRLLSAVKDGSAIDFLKEQIAKARRQTQKVVATIRRQLPKKDHATSVETKPSEETTAPIDKKAA